VRPAILLRDQGREVGGLGKRAIQIGTRIVAWDDDPDCKLDVEASPTIDPRDYMRELLAAIP
jgi:hypothetical protein